MRLHAYSDGGARGNPGPGAIGVVVFNDQGKLLAEHKDCIGEATNNIAEYLALIAAQELVKELNGKEVTFHLDSQLVVRQMQGEYKVKEETLKKLWQVAKQGEDNFEKCFYEHHPRSHEQMKHADSLVNDALDGE